MSDIFVNAIFDSNVVIASLVAALAGFISFLSPCVLPLLPGFIGYIAGVSASKVRILVGTVLFVSGFALLFTFYGALFGSLGSQISQNSTWLTRALGVLTIVFGLIFLKSDKFFWSWQPSMQNRAGLVGAPLLGFLFGLGWTPCIGPTLAAVETLAFQEANALRGAVLSLAYCFGLGTPFIFFGLLFEKSMKIRSFVMKRGNIITIIGGTLLVVMGIAQVFGLWNEAMSWLRSIIADFAPVI